MRNERSIPSSLHADFPVDESTIRVAPGSSTALGATVDQSKARVHCLSIIDGAEVGRQIVLAPGDFVIGRCAPADVSVADGQISRRHCRLTLVGHQLSVTDLQSTNGSYVHQRRIAVTEALPIGATLRLGSHLFRHEFRSLEEVQSEQALWRAPTASEPTGHFGVAIDPDARHQQVQKIVSSEFFDQLTRELEVLRRS